MASMYQLPCIIYFLTITFGLIHIKALHNILLYMLTQSFILLNPIFNDVNVTLTTKQSSYYTLWYGEWLIYTMQIYNCQHIHVYINKDFDYSWWSTTK